jgi:hypothetical protein
MRHIFAAVLIVLACASIADPASARTFRDPYGGRGDASASDECGPGKYFVGVVGRTGAWVDQIAVLCAELQPNGLYKGAKSIAARGGGGGAFHPAVVCPYNQVITKIDVGINADREVTSLEMWCVGPGPATHLIFGTIFGPRENLEKWQPQACIAGEAGKGLNINYGKYVNGIGIICDALTIPAAAPPPPPPPPPTDMPPPPPVTPPPPAEQFVDVLKDADVYTKPGGNDQDRKKDANGNDVTLFAGTQGVTLIERRTPWFHLNWPGQDGWVYSGSGWVSLKLP